MFTLNKAELKPLVCHASNDDTRACLNALGCFPRDGRIVTPLGDLVVDKLPGLGVAVYVVAPPGW